MRPLNKTPVIAALLILSVAHAALCLLVAGTEGLSETAIVFASGFAAAVLAGKKTVGEFIAWQRVHATQFRIWLICSGVMTLFLLYRSGRQIDVAILESIAAATFFLAMVSLGNRILK